MAAVGARKALQECACRHRRLAIAACRATDREARSKHQDNLSLAPYRDYSFHTMMIDAISQFDTRVERLFRFAQA